MGLILTAHADLVITLLGEIAADMASGCGVQNSLMRRITLYHALNDRRLNGAGPETVTLLQTTLLRPYEPDWSVAAAHVRTGIPST